MHLKILNISQNLESFPNFLIAAIRFLLKLPKINGDHIVSSTVSVCVLVVTCISEISPAVLEHGSPQHRELVISHLVTGLLEFSTHEQGFKSVTKALKEGGKEVLNRFARKLCEPHQGFVSPFRFFW